MKNENMTLPGSVFYLCIQTIVLFLSANLCLCSSCFKSENGTRFPKCSSLLMGQYRCSEPEIDLVTQQAAGCDERRVVKVQCFPAPKIVCIPDGSSDPCEHEGNNVGFYKQVPCRWTNGYKFETSLLLSIFLGMFGIDRFYLGYPAIGLLKFSTFGFFFLGQLIDVMLIATQAVKPSDGSDYVIDYYGAGIMKISMNNETIVKVDDYT